MKRPCTCVTIAGVLARQVTSQLPAETPISGTLTGQSPAAAALAGGRRSFGAHAGRPGGGTPAGLAAGGPDGMWVPKFEETEDEALAAAPAPLLQLLPAAAPLSPHFADAVAALPIR